jgi:DMSO/TMAO reductase YedYZ molybdopterin-dependent catalytic subunit
MHRRQFLRWAAGGAAAAAFGRRGYAAGSTVNLPFANGERSLAVYPQKRPLILQTSRPPQLETPFEVFNEGVITPNDAFFVRYHLAGLPSSIDPAAYRLEIGGSVSRPLQLSLDDLKTGFEAVEIVAVNQCSGNSRGFFEPRVAGGQFGNGAMGNARWRGVPLKAILDRAGLLADAKEVTFEGLDKPVLPATPAFVKSLDVDHARDGEVMAAYAMNGEELPFLNGYPVRLAVPGYYGTYWIKHLCKITVLNSRFDGFWMKSAYRIPDNDCACTASGTAAASTVPIGRYNVRSFITNLKDGQHLGAGRIEVKGIAFDGGYGITGVSISADGGKSWMDAALGEDLGKYSLRAWSLGVNVEPGTHDLKVRAMNRAGQSQPAEGLWNTSGYMRNAVETVRIQAA